MSVLASIAIHRRRPVGKYVVVMLSGAAVRTDVSAKASNVVNWRMTIVVAMISGAAARTVSTIASIVIN